ncbi:hypothetical protein BASA81_000178 [Batrachochytrium salamandrivorans]|nr:hypothetical protein BASA81_000178 [Batrachochytrium salamandrivorans]
MSDFSINELLDKSQQNGTKRGLGGATSGKGRIQIDYVDPSTVPATNTAALASMKPMPFIRFVPSSSASAPAPVKQEKPIQKLDDSESEEEPPKKSKSKKARVEADNDDSPLLKIVHVGYKEDLFAVLKSELKTHQVVNIWGQAKRATLQVGEEKETKVKHTAFVLNLTGSTKGGKLQVELSSKHNGSRLSGRAGKLVAGSMGLHVLFANGTTVDVPSHTEAVAFLEKQNEVVVSAWGEVESARLFAPAQKDGEEEGVEVKSVQFIDFSCKGNVASVVDQDGNRVTGKLTSCKADKLGLKVLLQLRV